MSNDIFLAKQNQGPNAKSHPHLAWSEYFAPLVQDAVVQQK